MKNKFVVYTALFGDYDNLIGPKKKFEGCDFICFTDQKHLKSNIWEIRIIEECDLLPSMMNRKYKILPHLFLGEYGWSLYVDANIAILGNPMDLATKYLTKYDMAVPKHFARDCVYDEAKECVITAKTKHEETEIQMDKYKHEGFPKNFGLGENSMLFRNHNSENIIKLMNDWWDELNVQTKRDQLSLAYILWKNGKKFCFMDENARGNKYFRVKPHGNELIKNCDIYNFLVEKYFNNPKLYKYCLFSFRFVLKVCKFFQKIQPIDRKALHV